MSVNQRQWRLICDEPATGRWNMACDEAILAAIGAGDQPPTLRLYAWEPACLSLGISQSAAEADFDSMDARGWQIVRRPTGGRAILHTDELTYSLTLPPDHRLAALDIVESYRQISGALMYALERLGAQPHSERRSEPAAKRPGAVCFEVPSHYEITVDGRKLAGSAQMRKKSGMLQHGSLPLYGDVARICDTLVYESDDAREAAKTVVRERATTLADAIGRTVAWDEAAAALADGFSNVFDVELIDGKLSDAETEWATNLEREKYGAFDHIHAR